MRKKLLSVLLCTAMAATMLTGCGGSDTKKDSSKEAKKLQFLTVEKFLTSVYGTRSSRAV